MEINPNNFRNSSSPDSDGSLSARMSDSGAPTATKRGGSGVRNWARGPNRANAGPELCLGGELKEVFRAHLAAFEYQLQPVEFAGSVRPANGRPGCEGRCPGEGAEAQCGQRV